jgi:hypothetical protein
MLQQTPVARVLPIYIQWMKRWPTAASLAQATPAEVITAWGRLQQWSLAHLSAPLRNQSVVYVHWLINVSGGTLIFRYQINQSALKRGMEPIDNAEV